LRVAVVGGHLIPAHGFSMILRDTTAVFIHETKVVLRFCMALVGGHPIPADRLAIVLRHALPIGVHMAKVVLGRRVALSGGATIPTRGFSVVLRDAFAQVIHQAEIELRYCITRFSAGQEIAQRLLVLGTVEGLKARLAVGPCWQA
jgi:Fe2+ transport system protein FeoA